MKPQRPLLLAALLSIAAISTIDASAQRAKYWVGGTGNWSDAAHWALSAGGSGGSGAPRGGEDAVIVTATDATVNIDRNAVCAALRIYGSGGTIRPVSRSRRTSRG